MKCTNCGQEVPVYQRTCPHCQQPTGSKIAGFGAAVLNILKKIAQWIIGAVRRLVRLAVFLWTKAKPHLTRFFSVRRNRIAAAAVAGTLLLLIVILALIGPPGGDPGLTLGDALVVGEETIPDGGGAITIDADGSAVDGMVLSVPGDAYEDPLDVVVSTREILEHDFGAEFTPITPLIEVDNGGGFAAAPMTLTIPIEIAEDEFAMGFFYEEATGTLEAMPIKDLTPTSITVLTNHFSEVVVAKIAIAELRRLTSAPDAADTGFRPGVDDWQFTNYGSFLAPGGHCAGQALTMAWYYSERKLGAGDPALYGRFDNDGRGSTPGLWVDDADAYRFASVVQSRLDFNADAFHEYIALGDRGDELVFYAFGYAMLVTGEPQLMAIYAHDELDNRISGHAILAYRLEQNLIYVADPNYPGMADRTVEFAETFLPLHFLPYSSGDNARAIADDGALQYDEIVFVGRSALIDMDAIAAEYDRMLSGTVGEDDFPTLAFEYLSAYDADPDRQEWTALSDSVTLGVSYNATMPCELQDTIVVAATAGHPDAVYTLYRGDEVVEGPYLPNDDGYVYFEIPIEDGENDFGILAEIQDDVGDLFYSDFQRFAVDYDAGPANPCAATVVGRYDFVSRSDGLTFVYNHHIDVAENGTFVEQYTVIESGYTNTISGTWELVETSPDVYVLYLSFGGTTDAYEVTGNFTGLRYVSGDIVFLFSK
ncbi:MAG: zinc ribbon domain-containing protein [Candidatus Izemoplasmatales bacterium]